MPYLLDSNILIRYNLPSDPDHQVITEAIKKLNTSKEELYYTSQNLAEFWVVLTRPTTARGGFGLSVEDANELATTIESDFFYIPDSEVAYRLWRNFLVEQKVLGVQAHDARLAAIMRANRITHILTLNTTDFSRFGVTAVHPKDV
jgi:predicted nucleic acid-binding protein